MMRPASKTVPTTEMQAALEQQRVSPPIPISPGCIAHVAKADLHSPFRFPGGKTWLVPRIRQWLTSWTIERDTRPTLFVEPFAGGGSVSLAVLFEDLADRVMMTELDDEIAAVWQTILDPNPEANGTWLASSILDFEPTPESVHSLLSRPYADRRERAFQTVVKNRVRSGGILAPGAGLLKRGEKDRGLKSRWYPETLVRRITDIASLHNRIDFIHGDGFETIRRHLGRTDIVLFVDPPYTAGGKRAGRRLYTHSEVDHQRLFGLLEEASGEFLMTYNKTDEVIALAEKHGFESLEVTMKNARHATMTELLVAPNLDWARTTGHP